MLIKYLPSLRHCLIHTHIVIQCTSMHAVPVDTWCMRTLPAVQCTSACMRSLTPVHLHVLDIINHSISWYLYLDLTTAAASYMHTLMQTRYRSTSTAHHPVLNAVLHPWLGASADPGEGAQHHTSTERMHVLQQHAP